MYRKITPYLFIGPSLFFLTVFLFLPVIVAFIISLTNWDIYTMNDFSKIKFVGIRNYFIVFKDPIFWKALFNTFYFVVIGVPLSIFISLISALLLNEPLVKFKNFFRTGYFTPVVTTLVAVAVVWKWLYNYDYGLINYFFKLLGITPVNWLNDPRYAMLAIIFMAVWKNFGYNMVIFLAGLQTIPESLYEAAKIDGADNFQCFLYITLPSLKPTTVFVVITTMIGYFQLFAEPYVMTEGGPLNSTLSIVQYMYNHSFKFLNFGIGASVSYILFLIILCVSVLQIKIGKFFK